MAYRGILPEETLSVCSPIVMRISDREVHYNLLNTDILTSHDGNTAHFNAHPFSDPNWELDS
jgi:hypothetical protein